MFTITKGYAAIGHNHPCFAQAQPAVKKEDLNTRLKRLINAHKCMLFMKGSPKEPKCGFR